MGLTGIVSMGNAGGYVACYDELGISGFRLLKVA